MDGTISDFDVNKDTGNTDNWKIFRWYVRRALCINWTNIPKRSCWKIIKSKIDVSFQLM